MGASFKTGKLTFNGSNQLVGAFSGITGQIYVKANAGNANVSYIGLDADLTAGNGFELAPGDGICLELNSAKSLMAKGTNGQGLTWATVGP